MGVTIHVNGKSNSLVHKGSMGIAKSTIPDVCKTPSPGGPVPIPYPVIISMSSDLAKGTKTVKVDGGNSAAIKGSEFSRCNGDEPGTAGGVKSSTNMKEATWILYSFDVKLEGKNACRLSDKMMMNHQNTACLGGEAQVSVPQGDCSDKDVVCCVIERCDRKHYDVSVSSKPCTDLGSKKHECVENSLKNDDRFECERSFNMENSPPTPILLSNGAPAHRRSARHIMDYYGGGEIRRPDVKTKGYPCQIFDAKFPCSDKVSSGDKSSGRMDSDMSRTGASMMSDDQRDAYQSIAGPKKKGGKVEAMSPGDCKKNDSCAKCE